MENLDFNTLEARRADDSVVATLMRNVYLWMTAALVITGLTAMLTAQSEALVALIFSSQWTWLGLLIAELVLVIWLSARIEKISFTTATIMFIVYSAINGLTLSSIFLVYEIGSIELTFFIAAGMYAAMALIGSFTKKDLSGIGKFLIMTLIGLIIAMVVNIFIRNAMFDFVVSVIGVVVFAGLTAYDAQKIRNSLAMAEDVNDSTMKYALLGALTLYLDFINLFLYLLRIFGNRK
ncbi:MAG: Bax inhibitor-1/YccA family protein [Paludibacteraceae bacterium]|nr:Bax inhibitor-1/YccA family protein [Paludibacteraceae bacterium]